MYNKDVLIEEISKYIGFEEEGTYMLPTSLKTERESKKVNRRYSLLNLKNIDDTRPTHIQLNNFLSTTLKRAVDKALEDIYIHKRFTESVRTNVQKVNGLYDISPKRLTPQNFSADFIGLRIAVMGSNYFTIVLNKIMLGLMDAQEITIYIYHSSNLQEPYKELTVNFDKPGSAQWFDAGDLRLSFFEHELDRGGYYYIGIRTEDLEQNNTVLQRKKDWNERICGSCNPREKAYQDQWIGFTRVSSVKASTIGEALEEVEAVPSSTMGFNLSFKIECDITDFLLEAKETISELALMKTAWMLCQEMEDTTRLNRDSGLLQDKARSLLHGEWNNAGRAKSKYGIVDEYEKALKAISFDLSRMGDKCIPCDRKKGIVSWS